MPVRSIHTVRRTSPNPVRAYRLAYTKADRQYFFRRVSEALRRGYLTDGGKLVQEFERKWSSFCGQKYAVATNSATTGLELLLRIIDVRGASVVVPSYTFFATPLSVINAGGTVRYADISRETLSLTLASVRRTVRADTKAVVIVHVAGVITPEIYAIRKFCRAQGIALIEDAACAHGAEYNEKRAGSFGDAAVFSFHHSKVLTSGEGGMIVTRKKSWAEKAATLRSIGIDRTRNNWEVLLAGNNYKMHEVTAALGLVHVAKVSALLRERRKIAAQYDSEIFFNEYCLPFTMPRHSTSAYYKYLVRVKTPSLKTIIRRRLKRQFSIHLPPNVYDHVCHEQKFSRAHTHVIQPMALPETEHMRDHHLCLPMYNGFTQREQAYVIRSLNKIISLL